MTTLNFIINAKVVSNYQFSICYSIGLSIQSSIGLDKLNMTTVINNNNTINIIHIRCKLTVNLERKILVDWGVAWAAAKTELLIVTKE